MKNFFIILLCIFFLVGCSSSDSKQSDGLIDYTEAKEKIINEGAILIDVRTKDEYDTGHIDGATLLTLDTINATNISDVVESKETTIIVYCRSGNRSHQALEKLQELGYENVYDLGAMSNWEE